MTCLFCNAPEECIFYRDDLVIGLWDGFPVSPGHALLIPKRHVPTWCDATLQEQSALMAAALGIVVDLPSTVSVAAWAYANAAQLNATAWVAGKTIEHLTGRWQRLLSTA